jgi:hypothetical protein
MIQCLKSRFLFSGILSLRRYNDDDVCTWEVQFGRLDDLIQKRKGPRNPVRKRRVTDLTWLDVGSQAQEHEFEDQSDVGSIASSGARRPHEGCSRSWISLDFPELVFK